MVQQKSMNVLDSWCGSILSHGWEILKQNWLHSVYNVHGHLTVTPHDLLTFSCFQNHSKPHCVHLCLHLYLCAHCTCVCVNKWFLYTCACVVYTYYAMRSFHLRPQVARGAISIISIQSNLPHTDCGTDSDASWQKPCARPIQIIRPWISIWKKYPEPLAADFHMRAILWACQFERHWAGWPRKRGLASVWERSPSTRQRRKNAPIY